MTARDRGVACCAHPKDEHAKECEIGDTDSKRELCLMCPGYDTPGYPKGRAWHRYRAAMATGCK